MRVLVACEFSGIVRDAFRSKGHDAWSCDLLPCESKHWIDFHIQADHDLHIFDIIDTGNWDLLIAHPPCTYLCVSGARYWAERKQEQYEAIQFFMAFAKTKVQRYCIENPVGIISRKWRKPDQYIQPYQFGHKISKKTGLWLKNLPLLTPTKIVEPEWIYYKSGGRCSPDHYKNAFSKARSKLRSITYQGIAEAMAEQWGV